MKTIGIAAEYNPFHRGHLRHLEESCRMAGGDAVVAVMSGDFVQRGEAAVFSKFARAEAACRSGADLVIELPLAWSLSSAEGFASGCVSLLRALHADFLSFGSETGEIGELEELAELFCRPDFPDLVRENLKRHPNRSFPAARQALAEELLGRKLPVLRQPNNILAVEYLKTIRQNGWDMRPIPVLREGAGHDDDENAELPSAAFIRRHLLEGEWMTGAIPAEAGAVFRREREQGRAALDRGTQELCLLSRLRMLPEEAFLEAPDAQDGAGERLYAALRKTTEYESLLQAAASRRFPLARIRRIALCAALGLKAGDGDGFPAYARILAFNEKGRALLHEMGDSAEVPLLTKAAHVRKLSGKAVRDFQLGAQAHDLYTLFYPAGNERICGEDWRRGPTLC